MVLLHLIHTISFFCTKLEFLDPVKARYKYWPEVKEKIHSERSFEDTVAVLSHLLKVKWTKETFVHKPSKEGLTCLLCSFGVSLAATSFNALVRPRKLHRRVSDHLQRCPATWKCNKIIGKHFKKGWKKWRVFRLKKMLRVWAACFVSYLLVVPSLAFLWRSTTLTFALNQSLAEPPMDCANFCIWHFQEELSKHNKMLVYLQ